MRQQLSQFQKQQQLPRIQSPIFSNSDDIHILQGSKRLPRTQPSHDQEILQSQTATFESDGKDNNINTMPSVQHTNNAGYIVAFIARHKQQ